MLCRGCVASAAALACGPLDHGRARARGDPPRHQHGLPACAVLPAGVFGFQERYSSAWRRVALSFRANRSVLGYELMNEPWPGSIWSSCAQTQGCPTFDSGPFAAFYHRVITAAREVDHRTLIFYEP